MHKYKLSLLIVSIFYLGSVIFVSPLVLAVPNELINDKHIFGHIVGLSVNETTGVDWLMFGNWRASVAALNDMPIQNISYADAFNAAIEMVKPNGSARHMHTITDFNIGSISQINDNSTVYNGTTTISLREGPVIDIPTRIQKSNDNSTIAIVIDPKSVDYHFGELPIFGIKADR